MTRFHLYRHAESAMNTDPTLVGGRSNETPLSPRGMRQARRLADYFLDNDLLFEEAHFSPAVRTRQTGIVALGLSGQTPRTEVSDILQEMSQGEAEGMPRNEVYTPEVLAQIICQGKDFKLPGGESKNDVAQRYLNYLRQVEWQGGGDKHKIAVFGHGIAIKAMVAEIAGESSDWVYSFPLDNASETVVDYDGDKFRVLGVGLDTQGVRPA